MHKELKKVKAFLTKWNIGYSDLYENDMGLKVDSDGSWTFEDCSGVAGDNAKQVIAQLKARYELIQ
jgi:hypothetical protein